MRNAFILLLIIGAMALQFCSGSKKATAVAPPKITYVDKVQPTMVANCNPCHFPPRGKMKSYDTYDKVKGDIDEILLRIQKNPGEKGFMPFKHPKLPDSTVQVYVQWKADGLLEK